MKRLIIVDINKYNYILKDNMGKTYNLFIRFFGLYEPKVNDYIYMPEVLLDQNMPFSFGPLKDKKGSINEEDFIKVITENKKYYLQRYYG